MRTRKKRCGSLGSRRRDAAGIASAWLATWVALSLASAARAEDAPEPPPEEGPVDEIVVRASRIDRPLSATPAAVGVVERDAIQLARQRLTLGEALVHVPGVFTQNRQNFAQDLRISIRGFGARTRFGIRGIELLVDGIPATLPDGQGQVDTLQLATAGRIEVVRGPSATLYGSAAGGVIRIESEAPSDPPTLTGRFALGSHGYRDYSLKASGQAGPIGILAGISRQKLGGYREHSAMESNVVNARADWSIDGRQALTAVVRLVDAPRADDPGGLTAAEKRRDRTQAAPRNLALDAGERLRQATSGLRYRLELGDQHETHAAAWFGARDFSNRLPFDGQCREDGPAPGGAGVSLERTFGGGSLQHVWRGGIGPVGNELLMGFDVELQRDGRRRRCLYQGFVGRTTLQQDEEVTSLRGFLQDRVALRGDLELVLGLGFDALLYRVEDRQPVTPDDPDDSGSRDFTEWSPMAAMTWKPDRDHSAWWRVSTSFEPPSTTELRNPVGGGFDPDLDPQRAIQVEIGARGRAWDRLDYEVAAYYIRLRDELVPSEVLGDVFYRNAGRTWRTGAELGLAWEIADGWTGRATYTFTTARFDEYAAPDGTSLAGNRIPGVPEQLLAAALEWRHPAGAFAAIEGRYVGSFYANDANTVESDAYGVVDLRTGWEVRLGRWALTPMLGLNNLGGRRYDDNVRINAAGGRYWEPAPLREVYGGASLAYAFGAL